MNEKNILLLSSLFTVLYVVSNILATKIIVIWWFTVTASCLCYPITFLISNIINEKYGKEKTKYIIKNAFIIQIIIVVLTTIVIYIPTTSYAVTSALAYKTLFSQNLRIVLGALVAFYISQKVNVYLYNEFKKKYNKPFLSLMGANTLSLLVDILIFISISFIGKIEIFDLVIMFISQYLFQLIFLFIISLIFNFLTNKKIINYKKLN